MYVYSRTGTTWTEGSPLVASDGTSGDAHQFGGAIKTDGTTLLIGAPGPDFSSTGIYAPGAAYVFSNAGGAWTEAQILQPDDSADGDQFGFSIALDGSTAIFGTPAANIGANLHQGAVYAFDGSTGTWAQSAKIVADDGAEYDQFGQSVAMQGGNALVGQWSHNDDLGGTQPPPKPGTVYLFSAARGTWSLSNEFHAGDASNGDSYGWDVGIDGTTLLIGSQATVGANTFQGTAYFYTPADPPIADVGPASLSFSLAPGASGESTLSIGNTGDQGAHFYLYSTDRTDGPWRYTVEAGKSLNETFDLTVTNGVYTFEVFGPNGFVRKFAGNTQQATAQNAQIAGGYGNNKRAEPEVKVQYDVANGNVFLKFSNKGGGIARLTVTDNAYGARARPVLVPAGAHIEEAWVLASSHHWYDLTVTSNDDASFSRRVAGHVENGRPSISDPAAVAPVLVAN